MDRRTMVSRMMAAGAAMGMGRVSVAGEDAKLVFRFHARDLHLVLAPSADGKPIRFRVSIDGGWPSAAHGVDVDAQGDGLVTDARLYQLIRQTRAVEDHTFTIEFLDAGARVFAFTFG